MEDIVFNSVDDIRKYLKSNCKKVIRIKKYDGITLECAVESKTSAKEGIKEVNEICKQLKLLPISTEVNKEKPNIFLLQFPELVFEPDEETLQKLYKELFEWQLDLMHENNTSVSRQIVEDNSSVIIKQCIAMYYRAHCNQYKVRLDDLVKNYDYYLKIEHLFKVYLDEYYK